MATDRLFELRTYRSAPGKLDALTARFRDSTIRMFAGYGIEVAGFFSAPDPDDATTGTLVYLCVFDTLEQAEAAWEGFRADPEWLATRAASEVDGPLTASVESLFLHPTDFSPMR